MNSRVSKSSSWANSYCHVCLIYFLEVENRGGLLNELFFSQDKPLSFIFMLLESHLSSGQKSPTQRLRKFLTFLLLKLVFPQWAQVVNSVDCAHWHFKFTVWPSSADTNKIFRFNTESEEKLRILRHLGGICVSHFRHLTLNRTIHFC